MPFAVVHDDTHKVVRATAFGTVSRDDVIAFLSAHWAGLSPEWALLFDTRGSTATYTPNDIYDFVSQTWEWRGFDIHSLSSSRPILPAVASCGNISCDARSAAVPR